MKRYFVGIDIADDKRNRGRVALFDDGKKLSVSHIAVDQVERIDGGHKTAIDSPFGYPVAFLSLVSKLRMGGETSDRYKRRETERRMSAEVEAWPAIVEAKDRVKNFFHSGRHVKSAIALEIVPTAIREVLQLLQANEKGELERRKAIEDARLGLAPVLEAHPRLFLYSILCRVQSSGQTLPLPILEAAKNYKTPLGLDSKEKNRRERNREKVLEFILERSRLWLGSTQRGLSIEGVCSRDHDFDAFLCALTAFMHANDETLSWRDLPGMREEVVRAEGHFFLLRPR